MGGRQWVGSESKAGFSSLVCLLSWDGACTGHAGGELTHRREGESAGLRGRRKHISIPYFRKGNFRRFSAPPPHSRAGLAQDRGDNHPLSCPGKPLHTPSHKRHKLLLLSRFSCVRLCTTPQTAAHQALPSQGFSRQEHGVSCHCLLQKTQEISLILQCDSQLVQTGTTELIIKTLKCLGFYCHSLQGLQVPLPFSPSLGNLPPCTFS